MHGILLKSILERLQLLWRSAEGFARLRRHRIPTPILRKSHHLIRPECIGPQLSESGNTGIRIFHAADDQIVPVTQSQRMAQAMKRKIGRKCITRSIETLDTPAGTKPTTNRSYFHGSSLSLCRI